VIYAATSLDGYLAPADGSVDWLESFGDGPELGIDAFMRTVGSLVTGRTTFDQVRSFGAWPYGTRPTAVLTRRGGLADLPPGARADDGADLPGLIAALQEESRTGSTWLLGGGAVHRTFMAEGLVDEIWTHVMPVLLGDGIAMLPPAYEAAPLQLLETRTYGNGVVMLRYQVQK
jgi:dihydrofolate reductase